MSGCHLKKVGDTARQKRRHQGNDRAGARRLSDGWDRLIGAVQEALRLGVTDAAAVMHILRTPDPEDRRRYALRLAEELEPLLPRGIIRESALHLGKSVEEGHFEPQECALLDDQTLPGCFESGRWRVLLAIEAAKRAVQSFPPTDALSPSLALSNI
jgi:hypothetical protein